MFWWRRGARGPHDEFGTAKNTIVAAYATFDIDQDLEAIRARFISEDLEYVTRLGTSRGPIDRESGEVAWKAWPAATMRIHGGKMVFFEGYIDRRRALAEYGLEQS